MALILHDPVVVLLFYFQSDADSSHAAVESSVHFIIHLYSLTLQTCYYTIYCINEIVSAGVLFFAAHLPHVSIENPIFVFSLSAAAKTKIAAHRRRSRNKRRVEPSEQIDLI